MNEESKPWYASRTVWGSVVAMVASVFLLTGHTIAPEIQSQMADILAQIGAAVGGAVALYGRFKARKAIA